MAAWLPGGKTILITSMKNAVTDPAACDLHQRRHLWRQRAELIVKTIAAAKIDLATVATSTLK
jgi:hypothetical protein